MKRVRCEMRQGEGERAKTHPFLTNSEAYDEPPSLSNSVGRTDKTMMNRVKILRKSVSRVCACVRVTHSHARFVRSSRGAPRARSKARESRRRSSVSVKRSSKREYISHSRLHLRRSPVELGRVSRFEVSASGLRLQHPPTPSPFLRECVFKGLPFSNNMTRRHFAIDLGQDYGKKSTMEIREI